MAVEADTCVFVPQPILPEGSPTTNMFFSQFHIIVEWFSMTRAQNHTDIDSVLTISLNFITTRLSAVSIKTVYGNY